MCFIAIILPLNTLLSVSSTQAPIKPAVQMGLTTTNSHTPLASTHPGVGSKGSSTLWPFHAQQSPRWRPRVGITQNALSSMSYHSCTPRGSSRAARCQCQQPQTGQARCPGTSVTCSPGVCGHAAHLRADEAAPIPTCSPCRHKGSRPHNYLNSRTNQSYKRR